MIAVLQFIAWYIELDVQFAIANLETSEECDRLNQQYFDMFKRDGIVVSSPISVRVERWTNMTQYSGRIISAGGTA